jgi:hypothetical protein
MSEDTGPRLSRDARRLAAERKGRRGGSRRWLMLFGIIVAVLISVAMWLKPPVERCAGRGDGPSPNTRSCMAKPGEAAPEVSHSESHDWGIAVSHT